MCARNRTANNYAHTHLRQMHSFDGTRVEALTATDFGLYIGINGW